VASCRVACKQVSTASIHGPLRGRPGLSRVRTLTGPLRSTSTNFRLGFKRVPLQAWLASQRLSGGRCSKCGSRSSRFDTRGGAPAPTVSRAFLAEGLLDRSPSMPLPVSHSCEPTWASWNPRVSATVDGSHHRPAFHGLAPGSASGTAPLVAEAVKPHASRRQLSWVSAALQGLTGRPCRGFRRASLHALAVPHRPLLEPQGLDRSHCGDSVQHRAPLPPGLSTLVSWPRLRWAACLAHGFTANTERVAASPLFASAGPRHLGRREAGLPRSGLSGRW
jgi:hypothetical protein